MGAIVKHIALATCIMALSATPVALAQETDPSTMPPGAEQQALPQQLTPAMRADIARGMAYPLPQDFLTRARDTLMALQGAGIQPPSSAGMDLHQTIETMRGIPGLPNILAAHGFSVDSFVMGMTAFGMTLAATNGQQLPPDLPHPNPANIALFHAHPQDVTALMQAMGQPPGATQ
ncbi:hypothetical protein AA101099_3031 [Neoasaia chiangmaiensis NBRC 101099]|uniref:Uncharacterized protein n=1 Tax=Neoasaia chiangmaiensis TaxID=320497 RepID=A0A1U9KNK3_9PROT|nr:hypothetical protein A0U93_04890 [Neoasaia chiangmaiensis]GBR42916.1 hypothetical protein AA101099_3031 [Neoasaia chiangmaiensis NBRC 101099]GEN16148.1 hypothetical protein NCH01_25790 [Neoasaia chiangmaiensis]